MGTAKFTPLARSDLKEIKAFIEQDNPKRAAQYMQLLKQKCENLALSPNIGTYQEEYCGLHKFPVDNYLIFYRPSKTGIEVIRVLHGKRDINPVLVFNNH